MLTKFIESKTPVKIRWWLCGGNECGLVSSDAIIIEEKDDCIVYRKYDGLPAEPNYSIKKKDIEYIAPINSILDDLYYDDETVSRFAYDYCKDKTKKELENTNLDILLEHLLKYSFEDIDTYIFNCNIGWYIGEKTAFTFTVNVDYNESTTVGDLFKQWAAQLLKEEINNITKILYN